MSCWHPLIILLIFVWCCRRTRFDECFVSNFGIFSNFAKIGHELRVRLCPLAFNPSVKHIFSSVFRESHRIKKKGASHKETPRKQFLNKRSIVNIEVLFDILIGTEDRYRVALFEKEIGREFQYNFTVSLDR